MRLATLKDYKRISVALSNKEYISYLTKSHVRNDIKNKNCYVLERNNKIIGIGSIIYDRDYKSFYIKRVLILNKKNQGKGYAKIIIRELSSLKENICVTPYKDNDIMIRILKSLGFKFRYNFLDNFSLYQK